MKIRILENFSDEGGFFYENEIREVTDQKAGYYCGVGWASSEIGVPPTGERDLSPKTLEIQSARNGVKSTTVGVK